MKEDSKEKKKVKKPNFKRDILINMIYAVMMISYFIALNLVYLNCETNIFQIYIKISYMLFLIIGLITIELSYKKQNYKTAIHGVEYIILAIYILLIERITTAFGFNMKVYIGMSSYIFAIYYTFKSILIDTNERRKKLKQLSDIKDIVKEEKPSKKVAKKRKV